MTVTLPAVPRTMAIEEIFPTPEHSSGGGEDEFGTPTGGPTIALWSASSGDDSGSSSQSTRTGSTRESISYRVASLARVVEALQRDLRQDVEAQTVLFLLEVAREPGRTLIQLADAVGVAGSAASRNADYLGAGSARRKGLGLVEIEVDPLDRRFKRVRLTPKGVAVIRRITSAIDN